MGRVAGYLTPSAAGHIRKYLVASSVAIGELLEGAASGDLDSQGSATALTSVFGMGLNDVTYDATPANATDNIVSVDIRPDAIFEYRYSGSATAGGDLTVLVQDTASTTVLTDGGVGTDDIDGGWIWRRQDEGNEAPLQEQRSITAFGSAASLTVATAFINSMGVGDRMLAVPQNPAGDGTDGSDGVGAATFTSNFLEIDPTTASGTDAVIVTYGIVCRSESDSLLQFLIPTEHVFSLADITTV